MMKKNALVTGASRGIGQSIASMLDAKGIQVLTPSRSELDLSSDKSITSYIQRLKTPIDILINNAGINPLGEIYDISDKNLEETLKVNLMAPLKLIRAVSPMMMKKKYGRIVNISSIWSIVSKPGRIAYSMSKSGINAMTRSVAVELAKYNILVNSVAPGYVNTELTRKNNTKKALDLIRKNIPIQRLAEPEEVAGFVSFLCSEENTYITGQTIVIDGGYTCL